MIIDFDHGARLLPLVSELLSIDDLSSVLSH